MKKVFNCKKGFSIVELLMVMGLAAIIFPALLTGFVATRSGRAQGEERLQAIHLLEEAQEAVRVVREKDWTDFTAYSIPPNQIYHPGAGSTWTLNNGSETINGLTRQITISDVSRDNNTNLIVADDAPQSFVDPSTKKVTVTVSWSNPLPTQVSSTTYLTRYLSNNSFADKSVNDFTKSGSKFSSTETFSPSGNHNSDDGQVVLAQSGAADWCDPGNHRIETATADLGNSLVGSVVAGTNRAFAGTQKSAASHPFYNIVIDNSIYPPTAAVTADGYYDAPGLKANDVFGESNYAYLAPDNNSNEEVIILDTSANQPTFLTSIDISGNKGSRNVFVSNNILYFITTDNKLYTYSVADHAHPAALGSPINVDDTNKMYVVNGYVFLALKSDSNQLSIIDATNPANKTALPSFQVNDKPGVDVFATDDLSRAYLVTDRPSSATDPNFFIIDTTNLSSLSVKGSGYHTLNMDPNGLTVIDNRAIIVGFNDAKYQVLRVKDASGNDTYDQCSAFTDIDNIYDVSSIRVGAHAYSYLVTDNTGKAFQIIEGGLGGVGGYVPSGSYESGTSWTSLPMPTNLFTAFNHFDVTFIKPTGTDIQFQVSVADAVSGSCSSFSYVGAGQPPTTGFFSTNPGDNNNPVIQSFTIPTGSNPSGYSNPGKCFRYKATLSTNNSSVTPAIDNIIVNYSK